ncbi:hypothetical protein ACIG56_00220 [Nocardia fusca]|uniref:hypothetical protein n=1 Tax=Nocardia fusca TaxID=941183 RepID=UPI0037C61DCD
MSKLAAALSKSQLIGRKPAILTTLLIVVVVVGALIVIPLWRDSATPATIDAANLMPVCEVAEGDPARESNRRIAEYAVAELLAGTRSYLGPCAEYGASLPLGGGRITAFSQTNESGEPLAVGLAADDAVYDALPYEPPSGRLWCHDKNTDGVVADHGECAGGHETVLPLGDAFTARADTPFTYILANWNPHGHVPPGVWDTAHFDVHFYLNDNAERLAIRPGSCPQLTHCDDYRLGKILPDPKYRHPDYVDLDAVEPGMGQHLIDSTTPELSGGDFTSTFIYGSWNGEITFLEPMVALSRYEALRSGNQEDSCIDIKQPQAWQQPGWYPTKYCLRHRDNRAETLTTLEGFVRHTAG